MGSASASGGIREPLAEFAAKLNQLPEAERSPRTAFGLLDRRDSEAAWQTYLWYFLDPTNPHDLGVAFLSRFLSELYARDAIDFEPRLTTDADVRRVNVEREWSTDAGNRPDIFVYQEEQWFLCLELKVLASEGTDQRGFQTERYARDDSLAPPSTDAYENRGFVYVAPATASDSRSSLFADVSWESIAGLVREFLGQQGSDVSVRTAAQLDDLARHIEDFLNMTRQNDATNERKNLYFEYRDEIEAAREAVDLFVDDVLKKEWADYLGATPPESDDAHQYVYASVGKPWGQIYAERWYSQRDGTGLDLHWEQELKTARFVDGELCLKLELEEPNRGTSDFDPENRYYAFREDALAELDELVPKLEAENAVGEFTVDARGTAKVFVEVEYDFDPGNEEAYYERLRTAIDELAPITVAMTGLLETNDYTAYPR